MPDFMLFLHQDLGSDAVGSPDEIMVIVKEYMAWTERMRTEGRFKGAERLADEAGKVMRPKDGRVVVTDGPYTETKEIIGGYYAITAKDYDEACRITASHPHLKYGGRIEIRQFYAR
jgi:hypothetical protein